MRLVQVIIPAGKREAVLDALDEQGIDYVVTEETSGRDFTDVVYFPLPTAAVEPVLADLRDQGLEQAAYTVVLEVQTVVSDRFEELQERFAEEEKSDDRIAREELKTAAEGLAPNQSTYITMTIVSAVVATAGLLLDSPATVVGSMVIAPLIGPAMSASVGTVLDDREMFRQGVKLQFLGIGIVILSTAMFAFAIKTLNLVPPGLDPTALRQVRQRLSPDFLSLAVALGSGTAGAVSLTTGVSSALVGVMIAVALIPPAATVGIGVAYGLPAVAISSGVLTLVNVLSINLAALVVLWYYGYRPERFFDEDEARAATIKRVSALVLAIAVLSVFLGGITYDSFKTATTEEDIRAEVDATLATDDYAELVVIDMTVQTERVALVFQQPASVAVTVGVPPDGSTTGLAERLQHRISVAIDREVSVQVRSVQVEQAP